MADNKRILLERIQYCKMELKRLEEKDISDYDNFNKSLHERELQCVKYNIEFISETIKIIKT